MDPSRGIRKRNAENHQRKNRKTGSQRIKNFPYENDCES